MIIKFLKQKTGDPAVALGYCTGEINPTNEERDEIRLIEGSPEDFVRVTSTLSFAHTFQSCVMSWSRGDAPTDEQLEEVLSDLKKLAFAGMDPSRFCYCVYLHRKADKVDIHVLFSNVDLITNLHFNVAPPKWEHSYYPFRDMQNARWGWASPKDPSLARPIIPRYPRHGPIAVPSPKSGSEFDAANRIQNEMLVLAQQGAIKDRAGLIAALAKTYEVNRANGKDYVSVRLPEFGKPIRLRGLIFNKNFEPSMLLALAPMPRLVRTSADQEADKDPVGEAAARVLFEAAVRRRALRNYDRYLAPRKRASKKMLISQAERVDLPLIDLALTLAAKIPNDQEAVPQEATKVTEPDEAMNRNRELGAWTAFLKQPSPARKAKREQELESAISTVVEGFGARIRRNLGERIRREIGQLAERLEKLGESVRVLAARLARRSRAERARGALEGFAKKATQRTRGNRRDNE
ncbi:relaxase/mobilization nuclease domain-containing protein [Variovorax boronicumulans]|uniref:relaxase/mobilization nuclease domain-containing protein n=1 Tax=Variovorax boronicumulans TaxID=436515 RepID=UPI001C59353F